MKNIAKAIIGVMKDVRGMEKNSKVGSGGMSYSGTKDQDVKEVFNEALAKHGLCIVPTSIESDTKVSRWQEETKYGIKQKQSVFTEVKTRYLLLHESGESVELAGIGHGVDPQDKGAGKATTYALKNCLLYTFLTPVGKIDDTDAKHSNDYRTPVKPKKKQSVVEKLTLEIYKKWQGGCLSKANGKDTIYVGGVEYWLDAEQVAWIKNQPLYKEIAK